jgi:hypothetical protein
VRKGIKGPGGVNAMVERDEQKRPLWVKIGLWGIPNRASAWAFFWISIGISVGFVLYGFVDRRFFSGGILLFAALWYYASIQWVDHHGGWPGNRN